MKKVLLPVATLVLSAVACNAMAANGNVKLTGEIVQSTCKIVDKDQSKEVFLGKYPTTAFLTAGSASGDKAFDISLENVTKVTLHPAFCLMATPRLATQTCRL